MKRVKQKAKTKQKKKHGHKRNGCILYSFDLVFSRATPDNICIALQLYTNAHSYTSVRWHCGVLYRSNQNEQNNVLLNYVTDSMFMACECSSSSRYIHLVCPISLWLVMCYARLRHHINIE